MNLLNSNKNPTWIFVLFVDGRRDLLTDGFHLLNSSVAVDSLIGFAKAFFLNGFVNGPVGGVTFGRVDFISSNDDDVIEIVDDVL